MVIISDYTLSSISDTLILVESKCESFCPQCGMQLTYRDSRKRIKKEEGGNNRFLIIRRLRCDQCHRLHNELPDCVVPHKHYSTDVISGVLDEVFLNVLLSILITCSNEFLLLFSISEKKIIYIHIFGGCRE